MSDEDRGGIADLDHCAVCWDALNACEDCRDEIPAAKMAAAGFTLVERSHSCFALVRDDAPVWVVEFEAIEGVRPALWRVYYACAKVKNPAAPWSTNNRAIEGDWLGSGGMRGFSTFSEAVQAAREWRA